MNALVAAPLIDALRELAAQVERVADGLPAEAPVQVTWDTSGKGDVVDRLLTIRAGLVGVAQPDASADDYVAGKVEGLEIAIAMLGGKVPKDRRRPPASIELPAPVKQIDGRLVVAPTPKMDRKLLAILASRKLKPTSQEQLAVLSGYSVSGSFTAALGRLRGESYIEGSGEDIRITLQGLVMVPIPSSLSSSDVRAQWLGKLGRMERRMLEVLLEAYPHTLTDDELADRTGYSISGSFTAALGKLRRLALAERPGPGESRVAEELQE